MPIEFYLKQVVEGQPSPGRKRKKYKDIMKCELEGMVCGAMTRSGKACTRRTVMMLPLCWQHAAKRCGVRAKPSGIRGAGRGLFADVRFERGKLVGEYLGEDLNEAELEVRYPGDITGPYTARHTDRDLIVDAACSRHFASLINHTSIKRQQNCALLSDDTDGRIYVRTTQVVPAGKEFLASYGDDYRFDDEAKLGVVSGTRRVRRRAR